MKYVSGIRPSGKLHLGNYLGALKHWKKLHDSGAETYFFVADMHGQYSIRERMDTLRAIEGMGISVFLQSYNAYGLLSLQHELSFYANTSRLDNMTQYKDKGDTLALYSYPVLMAADILYHEATHVPIGDDQKQHLELVRELARKTGRVEPEAVINPVGSRIMDLKDPTKKMSKSSRNPDGVIYLSDDADEIARKIKGAVTDMQGVANLLDIVDALGSNFEYNGMNEPLKKYVTDLIVNELRG